MRILSKTRLAMGVAVALLGAAMVSTAPAGATSDGLIDDAAPGKAVAGGPAMISRNITLTADAVTGSVKLPAGANPRVIDLAKGHYMLTTYLSDSKAAPTHITHFTLNEGEQGLYNWRCYIDGTGVAFPNVNYRGSCLLDAHKAGVPSRWLRVAPGVGVPWPRYHGTFYWESKLFLL